MLKLLNGYRVVTRSETSLILLVIMFVLNSCGAFDSSSASKIDNSVVATVGERTISVADLKINMIKRSGGATAYYEAADKKRALLDEVIRREVQVITAKKAGYDKDPAIIKALENMMITKLREDQLTKILSEVSVSNEESNDYYQANIDKYTTPAMSRIAIIKFAVYNTATEEKRAEVKAKAEKVLKLADTLAESVKGFGSLAAQHSEDQASRYTGGDIGWIAADQSSSRVDKAVQESIAELSEKNKQAVLVKGTDGYYLVKLIDSKRQQIQAFDKVTHAIQNILQYQKRTKAEADWLSSLQGDVKPVKINQTVLESVQPPASTAPVRGKQHPPALPKG